MRTHVFLSALLPTIFALPAVEERNGCKFYTDTFDDLGTAVAPQAMPIGTYDGVTYSNFDLGTAGIATGTTDGVIPQSGKNDAVASITSDLIQAGAVAVVPFGSILAKPSQAFDLYSFYFGCGQYQGSAQAPGVPVGCTLSVTGYTVFGQLVPVATFSYAPTNSLGSKMVLAVLPQTFRLLQNVTLGVASTSAVTSTTILDIDNVQHCNY